MKSLNKKLLFPVIVAVLSILLSVFVAMYVMGEKCDNDIKNVNDVIKRYGGINTDDNIFQQLGKDGCADLSKSTKGFITTGIQSP